MKEKQIHKGHRQRLKNRFLKDGLDDFNEINALELLLFYCIPKQDTNELAHDLLSRFGSFARVLDADPGDLKKVKGVGDHVSTFLKLIVEAGRYYQVSRTADMEILSTLDDCGRYLLNFFHGRMNETVYLLCLDAKCMVLRCEKVGEGSVNSTNVSIRKIVELALKAGASSVVLAHNHPSGIALPSPEDVQTTLTLAKTLHGVDVKLLDHIVVADDDYVSMTQSKYFRPEDAYMDFSR